AASESSSDVLASANAASGAASGCEPDGAPRWPESLVITDRGRLITPSNAARRPSASSFAVEKRSAAFRAQAFANHASIEAGNDGFASEGFGGVPVAIMTASAPNDGPS